MAFLRLAVFWLGLVLVTSAFSCEKSEPAQVGKALPRQIIIKFKPGIEGASDNQFLSSLGFNSGAGIEYIRPMSGNAHVIRIKNPLDQATLEKILRQLNNHKDVDYAEEDKRMQIQIR